MEALAAIAQLAVRLPFVMDEDELREAGGALDDLSDEARFYGNSRWTTPTLAPYAVVNMVLKAAARHMKNYEGFVTSRAGDETTTWTDRKSNPDENGSATFSAEERGRLAEHGGKQRSGFHSVGMFAYQRKAHQRQQGLVPDPQSATPIHYFSDNVEPW